MADNFYRPFRVRINFAECPGGSLAPLTSIICRAFSAVS
jgi:hypothetical protein